MQVYTPLRYPGGKRRLAPTVMELLEENRLHDVQYVEPYAGGSAVALALLFEEYAARVHINDLSRPVYAFWYSVLNHTEEICRRLERVTVTMRQWRIQRAVYEHRGSADLLELGFATLFLNRVNRSGIIGGGVIGGKEQRGKWRLDVRFNRRELLRRIRRIARYKNRISLYQSDALDFTANLPPTLGKRSFIFFDPPYIENGNGLYLNEYTLADHQKLAHHIAGLKRPWIVTYDRAAVKYRLYPSCRRILFDVHYMAQSRYKGREVLFLGPGLKIPTVWARSSTIRMGRPRSKYPLYGRIDATTPPRTGSRGSGC